MTSSRRSPLSYLDTNDCGFPRERANSVCVIPTSFRESISNLRSLSYWLVSIDLVNNAPLKADEYGRVTQTYYGLLFPFFNLSIRSLVHIRAISSTLALRQVSGLVEKISRRRLQ